MPAAAKKRYTIRVDSDTGRLVCVDRRTGKPVGLDRCTTVKVRRDTDEIAIIFNKRRCGFAADAEREFVARVKAGKTTAYEYSDDADES